jgi:hypothetical protein
LSRERDELRKALDAAKAEAAAAVASVASTSTSASAASEAAAALSRERDELRKALDAAKAEAAAAVAASLSSKVLCDSLVKEQDELRKAFDAEARRRADAETKAALALAAPANSANVSGVASALIHDVHHAVSSQEPLSVLQSSPSRSFAADVSFRTPGQTTFRDKVSNARDQLLQALEEAKSRASHAKETSCTTSALLRLLQESQPQSVLGQDIELEATRVIRNASSSETQALTLIEQLSQQLDAIDVVDSTAELASQIHSISQSSLLPTLNSTTSKSRPTSSLSMATKITNQYYSLSSMFSGADSVVKSPLLQAFAKERDVLKKALEIEVQARHKLQDQAVAATRAMQLAESRICSVRAKAATKEGLMQQALSASDRKVQSLQRELEMLQQSSGNHTVAPFLIASEATNSSLSSPRLSFPCESSPKTQRLDYRSVDLYRAVERSSDSALKTLKECGLKIFMSRKDLLLLSNYHQPLFQLLTKMRGLSPLHQLGGSPASTAAAATGSRPKSQGIHDTL